MLHLPQITNPPTDSETTITLFTSHIEADLDMYIGDKVKGTSARAIALRFWATVCKAPFIRYNLLSNRLYNPFDNRLYRVNGVSKYR